MAHKILIVDDEEDIQRIMAFKLKQLGYNVITAPDGKVALNIVSQKDPDLILLDVVMPGLDGYDVCKKLREQGYKKKIIIYTAKVDAVNATNARLAGADDFTAKTSDFAEIIASMKALLEK